MKVVCRNGVVTFNGDEEKLLYDARFMRIVRREVAGVVPVHYEFNGTKVEASIFFGDGDELATGSTNLFKNVDITRKLVFQNRQILRRIEQDVKYIIDCIECYENSK